MQSVLNKYKSLQEQEEKVERAIHRSKEEILQARPRQKLAGSRFGATMPS